MAFWTNLIIFMHIKWESRLTWRLATDIIMIVNISRSLNCELIQWKLTFFFWVGLLLELLCFFLFSVEALKNCLKSLDFSLLLRWSQVPKFIYFLLLNNLLMTTYDNYLPQNYGKMIQWLRFGNAKMYPSLILYEPYYRKRRNKIIDYL